MDRAQLGEWESSEKVRYGRSKTMSIGQGQIEREGVSVISGNETSNRFNSYLIIYKESSPFIYYVLPRGQKTTSYNEFIDPPKMINIVVVLMIRMDYGMSARFVVKYLCTGKVAH